jgi:hypothetical protein
MSKQNVLPYYYVGIFQSICGKILTSDIPTFLTENNNLDIYIGAVLHTRFSDSFLPTTYSPGSEIYFIVFGFKKKENPNCIYP